MRAWVALSLAGVPFVACSLFNGLGDLEGSPTHHDGGSTGGTTTIDAPFDGTWPDTGIGGSKQDSAPDAPPETADEEAAPDSPPDVVPDAASTYANTVLQDSPVLYWRLDEPQGTTANDSSSTQLHPGTYVSSVAFGQPGAIVGETDTAVVLNGGWIEAGDIFDFANTAPFTLEIWVRPSSPPTNYARLVTKDLFNPNRNGWDLIANDTPQPGVALERWQNSSVEIAAAPTVLSTSAFTHVVATYDGSTIIVYLNGQQSGTAQSTYGILDNAAKFRVGAFDDTGASAFSGAVDEVAIYDHPLAADRVLMHYKVGSGM